ncbi:External alternative NAD(P)H-ubiquinone oxidoreductase B1, mitochondrial [Porphyridium purpureum]|uniref:NADH:ubiquinone reductase (non-electrogenic) n=1 Tax=Porphyridium purpureum TaxID=35688 RepID=A0A5J4Z0T9_PORPP|nr:External alternative NAD(P)H-ubiquinone oxidoreductase B1, mitochondrial [Porphyridium purpureum]|eukprot:POR2641..scf208_2
MSGWMRGLGARVAAQKNGARRWMSVDAGAPPAPPKKRASWFKRLVYGTLAGTGAYVGYRAYLFQQRVKLEQADDLVGVLPEGRKRVVVLGTGWGAMPVLRGIDSFKYEVVCVSPRNYFLMTPLLPSVAVGTVETRTVCESLRSMLVGKKIKFYEAECQEIDPKRKVIVCGENHKVHGDLGTMRESDKDVSKVVAKSSSRAIADSTRTRPSFELEYDYLIVAVGAENQTFNTPGVKEHAHFLKELPDARRIRAAISDAFESAAMPGVSADERQRLLHFVVVGGGPTGVEFAAELNDLVNEDLNLVHKKLIDDVKITLVEALPGVLTMYDKSIAEYTMKHFSREHIDVMANTFVKGVTAQSVKIQKKGEDISEIPCALVVWATGIKPRPLVDDLRKAIGEAVQSNRRALVTNQYLEVKGADGIMALGDCATIDFPKMVESVKILFEEADTVKDDRLSLAEFQALVKQKAHAYPQLEFFTDAVERHFKEADLNADGYLSMEEFHALLDKIDKKIKILPATAQVANQQGMYLAAYLNSIDPNAEDPHQFFSPFQYKHMGSLAYIGSDEAIIDLTGTKLFNLALGGRNAFYLWRSFYFTEMFTMRTKMLLFSDWMRAKLYGRDISRV